MEKKVCLQCGKELTGRTDKMYCCAACKNRHHNTERDLIARIRKRTLRRLTDNYSILELLIKSGRTSIGLSDMGEMGFDTSVITSCGKDGKGHTEYCCFDIRYCRSETKIFNIRRDLGDRPD